MEFIKLQKILLINEIQIKIIRIKNFYTLNYTHSFRQELILFPIRIIYLTRNFDPCKKINIFTVFKIGFSIKNRNEVIIYEKNEFHKKRK